MELDIILSDFRVKYRLNEDKYFALRTWIRENNHIVMHYFHEFIDNNDIEGFKDWLYKNSTLQKGNNRNEFQERPKTREERFRMTQSQMGPREYNAASQVRPSTTRAERRGYHRFIQVVVEMESQGLLDQRDLGIIKALILKENLDVMKEFDNYFLHSISLNDLGVRLQKLADRLSLYMERPASPMPRKNELQILVDSLVKANLPCEEDIEILNKLITSENEFVFSAFDVFESDRDQEELVDSLMRAIQKFKKQDALETLPSTSFYPNPPPIESAPCKEDINPEFVLKIIQKTGIGKNWAPELKGVLKSLIQEESRILYKYFENFLKNEDKEALESYVKFLCNSYYQILVSQFFSHDEIKTIKLDKKANKVEILSIFETYENDGNTNKFINSLNTVLNNSEIPKVEIMNQVVQMIEEDENEGEIEAYSSFANILSQSSVLAPYRQALTQLYDNQDSELLEAIQTHQTDTGSIEEILLKIVQENSMLLDIDSKIQEIGSSRFTEEQVAHLQNLADEKDTTLLNVFEQYQITKNDEELISSLEVFIQRMPSVLQSEEEEFRKFIQENFDEPQQEKLLKMFQNQDSRLKSAIGLHDFASDKEVLVETLTFLIQSNEDL
ncbi:unnamed protein product [Blepharisma stoltei]|uniref:Uncharacterized protein n=1 Tax=Blepharisma stoltei TaxID=1481888 RepID=A0AAU9J5L9_9CILI|nr:unnamed protein product [Blepharisma stoltei]